MGNVLHWIASHEAVCGFALIGFGTIVVATSGIAKTKAERASASRKLEERSRSWRYWLVFWTILLMGAGINVGGTWLAKRGGDDAVKKQNEDAARILRDTKEEHAKEMKEQREQDAKVVRELREERQSILAALNSARQEESKKITEEKIHVIQGDFSQWADNFSTNLASRRAEFAQLKSEFQKSKMDAESKQIQEQVQVTAQA